MKRFRFKTLPQYLILTTKRFERNLSTKQMDKNKTIINYPLTHLTLSTATETVKYNLVANVAHEGMFKDGVYRAHVKYGEGNTWLRMQDLFVEREMGDMVVLAESCVQIWERV